jgi:hypothetical protein
MSRDEAVLLWKVRCINTESKGMFDRELFLDVSEVPVTEREHIAAVIKRGGPPDQIAIYRGLFHEISKDDIEDKLGGASSFQTFGSEGYVEDENGNGLDEKDLIRIRAGHENFIRWDSVEGILSLGAAGIREKDTWTKETANALWHFIGLVRQLARGQWMKTPTSLSLKGGAVTSCEHPDAEATMGSILLIRQLYSDSKWDNVFNVACDAYLRHVDHDLKRDWVNERKAMFAGYLNSKVQTAFRRAEMGDMQVRELLDMITYGSPMVHRRSSEGEEEKLRTAIETHGREVVVTTFNFCAQQLCRIAFPVYHVVRQDFLNWITNEGCVGPDNVSMQDLFG